MKVKLLVSRAGVRFSQARGEIIDVSDAEGQRLIDCGQAEMVAAKPKAKPKPETTAKSKSPETAAKPKPER